MLSNKIPTPVIARSKFNLSHDKKLTGNLGIVYPTFAMDCVPGDVVDIKNSFWCNFQPMVAPFLEDVVIRQASFFVPYRILDENFEKIVTASEFVQASDKLANVGVNASGITDNGDGTHTYGAIKVTDDPSTLEIPKWYSTTAKSKYMFNLGENTSVTIIDDDTSATFATISVKGNQKKYFQKYVISSSSSDAETLFIKMAVRLGLIPYIDDFTHYSIDDWSNISTSVDINEHQIGSLWDYLGFPTDKTVPSKDSAPYDYLRRAYYKIWNEFIRDEKLQNEVDITDVDNDIPLRAGWEKDYFTNATLSQQLGVAPALPLSGTLPLKEIYTYAYGENVPANVVVKSPAFHWRTDASKWFEGSETYQSETFNYTKSMAGDSWANNDGASNAVVWTAQSHNAGYPPIGTTKTSIGGNYKLYDHDSSAAVVIRGMPNGCSGNATVSPSSDAVISPEAYALNPMKQLGVDATSLATFDVADLRLVSALQRWKERNNRVGVRYTEYLQANYGVFPRDDRLQRPELIGQTKNILNSSPVIQHDVDTSASDATPVGTKYGIASTLDGGYLGRYHVVEFGCIMTLTWLKPKCNYTAQGINRSFLKNNCYDLFNPLFTHISDQEIKSTELYMFSENDKYHGETLTKSRATAVNSSVWGFAPRYEEMRYMPNLITSGFRDTFDYWHFGRKFDTLPELSGDFIECNPADRVFAVQDEDNFMLDVGNIVTAMRPIPYMSTPSLM